MNFSDNRVKSFSRQANPVLSEENRPGERELGMNLENLETITLNCTKKYQENNHGRNYSCGKKNRFG
jgi:hypothetical protein